MIKHTPGPWRPCFHLRSAENDASCPCGFRGSIWGSDGEHVVCEIGSTLVPGEEALCPPRYDRPTELANARLIAAAPDLLEALIRLKHWAEVAATKMLDSDNWPANLALDKAEEAIVKAESP